MRPHHVNRPHAAAASQTIRRRIDQGKQPTTSRHPRPGAARDSEKFNDQDKQLIKFHGSYQQDNRDARKDRHKEGAGKAYMFMVRCKIPGGKVTASQYLAIDRIAEQYANGTIRITSRQ